MWVGLFCTALFVAIVWLAALFLAIRDRVCGAGAPPRVLSEHDGPPAEAVVLPRWKRLLLVPVALLLGPPVILVVSLLVAPLLVVQFGFFAYHWVRLKLFGIPMPPVGPPEAA